MSAFAQLTTPSTSLGGADPVSGTVSSVTGAVSTALPISGIVNQTTNSLLEIGIVLNNVQSTSGTTSPSNQITMSDFNTGVGTDKLLLVGISSNSNNAVSVTFGGVSLKQAVLSFHNNNAEFWYLTNPSGTGDIVVTMAGQTQAVVGAYSFANVDQANPMPSTHTSYNTAPSSPSITVTTNFPGDWVIDLPSIWGGVILDAPTCTQEWNNNVPDAITGASSSRMVAYNAMVTCGWTASGGGDMWDDVAVELKPSGATIFGILGGSGSTSGSGSNSTSGSGSNSTSGSGSNSTSGSGGSTSSTGITVFAHRIPASYWDPCFAATCDQGTGPGVTMWIALYNSTGGYIEGGFADEHGYTFPNLNPSATYYVYPTDCDNCHGSPHDVVFQYWGDNHSSQRPRAATVGQDLHAWYSCTNSCADGP